MAEPFAARFAAVREHYGPLVWGLDPSGALLDAWGFGDSADGLDRFVDVMMDAVSGTVGLVKPQSAFYERHGWRGFRTLQRLLRDARASGVLVILDVKRGDVGTTNEAYAEAFLGAGAPLEADAVTVHPYLGLGAMDAFVSRAHKAGACLLVVTRSSNPEGRATQSARGADGLTVEETLLRDIGQLNAALAPEGIGPICAVFAPTHQAPVARPIGSARPVPCSRCRKSGRYLCRRGAHIWDMSQQGHAERISIATMRWPRQKRPKGYCYTIGFRIQDRAIRKPLTKRSGELLAHTDSCRNTHHGRKGSP